MPKNITPKKQNGNGAPILNAIKVHITAKAQPPMPPTPPIKDGPLPGFTLFIIMPPYNVSSPRRSVSI